MSSFRKLLTWTARVTLVLAAIAVAASVVLTRDPRPRFEARRSTLISEVPAGSEMVGSSTLQRLRLTASSGLAVDITVRREIADSGRTLPAVVILGGHLTGAEAARLVGPVPGLVVVAMSYPFTGNPRPSALAFLKQLPAIRGAFLDTPPALMLVLDHVTRRTDVDTARVEAVGVSLGAPFVTIAGALDQRINRVWALHGSGGSYAPLEASMRRSIGFPPLRHVGAAVASVIIAGPRLAPERWVADIAPRPFIMVSAAGDERLPRASVEDLYRAAREPKEIIWMDGGHVRGDAETIGKLVAIVMSRIVQSG